MIKMYSHGKIYKITCGDLTYYGSTCSTLCKRLWGHKGDYNLHKNGKRRNVTSFQLFDNGEPIITLVEDFPCERKEQLLARERWYIENNDCVNKQSPGLTRKETQHKYIDSHKDEIKAYNDSYDKEYRDINKETIDEKRKNYRVLNAEILRQKTKMWQLANPEKDSENHKQWAKDNPERRKEIANKYAMKDWKCECCDVTIKICGMARHIKTAKHIKKSGE